MRLKMISFRQIESLTCSHPCLIVDLREPVLYNRNHYPGAVNIYREELLDRLDELPKDKYIILYCERGGSAMWAGRELQARGYKPMVIGCGYKFRR